MAAARHSESAFETVIEAHLLARVYLPVARSGFDRGRAIFSQTVLAFIAAETTKLDAIRPATERTIALLNERRAALIAAAVTGQIDVGGAEYYTDDAAGQKEPERRQ